MDGERGGGTQGGVVLLHGSELGGWVWDPVVAELSGPALAVDLPGRDASPHVRRGLRLDDAVDSVVRDVQAWGSRPVVLVAHSFAGVLVPGVVAGLGGQVKAVVWVAATVPETGKSWADLLPAAQRRMLRVLYRVRPAGMLSPRKQNLRLLCNDLDEPTAAALLDCRVAEAPGFLMDPVGQGLPDGVASHYVRLLRDLAQSEEMREESIARLSRPELHDLDSGHLPMVSQPAQLAALIEEIAAAHEPAPEQT